MGFVPFLFTSTVPVMPPKFDTKGRLISISTETVGDFLDEGIGVTAYCHAPGCDGTGRPVDLQALAARFGRDRCLIGQTWRCQRCGKVGSIRLSPRDRPTILSTGRP